MGQASKMTLNIRARLLCWFLLLALGPASIIGYLAYQRSREALELEVTEGLIATARGRAEHISDHLDEKKKDLSLLAWDPNVVHALQQFNEVIATHGMLSVQHRGSVKAQLPFFNKYKEVYELYDLFLISPRGDIVLSIAREADFGTNLKQGEYRDTELASAFRNAISLLATEVSDFRYYRPSGQPGAFMVAPVLHSGKLLGAVALQIDTAGLHKLVSNYSGLGSTGEIILSSRVGGDAVFMTPTRHDPRAAFRRKVAIGSSHSQPLQRALAGNRGHGTYVDYRGKKVLAAWRYLPHLRMGMVVKKDASEAFTASNRLAQWSIALGILTLAGVLIIVFVLSGTISRPIRELTEATRVMATGDLTHLAEVSTSDEIGDLARGYNSMIQSFRDIAAVAEAVSTGDLEQKVPIKSERDTLGYAVNKMTENLQQLTEQHERDRWLKTGQTELAGRMQGQPDLGTLSNQIVEHLVEYLGAQAGALYVADSEGTLWLSGAYAHGGEDQIARSFTPGEGLVGQAASMARPIVLSEVPEDYGKVRSALGGAVPRAVGIFPLVHEGEIQGVLEVGSLTRLAEEDRVLLQTISEAVAVAINSAKARERAAELLAETRRKSEELQRQSGELRAANEELEEQTEALRRSEEELQSQQAELQATNEELEEKSEFLSQQKSEIERKNQQLERTQQELEQKAEELALSSRYKSEFLANMSHELRTPLNSLLILAKVLADNEDGNLDGRQVEAATVIHTSGRDLLNLINDILDLSKVEAGMLQVRVESVDLEQISRSLERQLSVMARQQGISLSVELDPGLPGRVISDGKRLEQILRNLLSNAIKFTEQGAVRLHVHRPAAGVLLQDPRLADGVAFSVEDSGVGIPEAQQQAIFEAFQQVDGSTGRNHGGTGLGLAISRELARLLGGQIQVRSHEGEGSTFTLYLPPRTDAVRTPSDRQRPTLTPIHPHLVVPEPTPGPLPMPVPDDRQSIRDGDRVLLIIEDDPASLEELAGLARGKGYRCLCANDGASGLRLAHEFKPTAIILDLGLPDVQGLGLLKQLKADPATREIPVQILSAQDPDERSLEAGAMGFLTKPASREAIEQVFLELEQQGQERIKSVLLLEDEQQIREIIGRLLRLKGVQVEGTGRGQRGLELLREGSFDCVILDLQLEDMSGFDWLRQIDEEQAGQLPPLIIYTGRELTRDEHQELLRHTSAIVVKGANSHERLLDEATMFLHSVDSSLPEERRAAVRMVHDPEQVLEGRKVLLVDDDMRNNFALSSVLQRHGIQVVMADNGQVCLDRLAAEPDVDMIIMDIMMPVMDGYEAMRRVRAIKEFVALPIIALTAKAMPDDRARCVEAGASDYMTKPLEVDRLLSMMRVWLYRRT